MILFEQFTGVILAGGKSSRFGEPKAAKIINGKPLIHYAAVAFQDIFSNLLIVASEEIDSAGIDAPVVSDIFQDKGPLGGLHAGLTFAETPYIFVTACDQPFPVPSLVSAMAAATQESDCEVLVPRTQPYLYPLFACYSKRCLPVIESQLSNNILQINRLYPSVNTRYADREWLEKYDPELRSLFNINTQEDLKEGFR